MDRGRLAPRPGTRDHADLNSPRIIRQRKDEAAYASGVSPNKSRGFAFIEEVRAALETYKQDRDKYLTLGGNFPQIIGVFAPLHESAEPTASTS